MKTILSKVFGWVTFFEKVPTEEGSFLVSFREIEKNKQALSRGSVIMQLNGQSHTLYFHEHFIKTAENQDQEPKPPLKEELRIMLKRQVLREMIYDPDFNQPQNFATFG